MYKYGVTGSIGEKKRGVVTNVSKEGKINTTKLYFSMTGSTGEKEEVVANVSREGKINPTGVYQYGITGSTGEKKRGGSCGRVKKREKSTRQKYTGSSTGSAGE